MAVTQTASMSPSSTPSDTPPILTPSASDSGADTPPLDLSSNHGIPPPNPHPTRLHGRAFYESIGSPKYILAPMVEHSHLAWRILVSRHLPKPGGTLPTDPSAHPCDPPILSYTPMLHSRLYSATPSYPAQNFPAQAHATLDGSPAHDRPLIAQFCANDPTALLSSAHLIAPYVDAIDLNLGCPQGIARKGHYGSFLQDDWPLITTLISTLHTSPTLPVPITAKIRIFPSHPKTLQYARQILRAGASILAVHGRTREQKGHNTGLACWATIAFLRKHLPPDTVLVANGNILWPGDAQRCLSATGADAVMSAEGALYNPTGIFLDPKLHPPEHLFPRVDIIAREYLTIIRSQILPPYLPPTPNAAPGNVSPKTPVTEPNLTNIKSHLFKLLHALLPRFPEVRGRLSTARPLHPGNYPLHDPLRDFEGVVGEVEKIVGAELRERPEETLPLDGGVGEEGLVKVGEWMVARGGWVGPKRRSAAAAAAEAAPAPADADATGEEAGWDVPWYRCQPYLRALPEEAVRKGAMSAVFLEGR